MKIKNVLGIIAILALLTIGLSAALLSFQVKISAQGTIKTVNIAIYSDQSCTAPLTSINWGTLSPGQTVTLTCYLKSTSTVDVTLSMTTGNWNPTTAASYINLSWNRAGYTLSPNTVVSATLTLTVSSSITGITAFTFDITVTATEA